MCEDDRLASERLGASAAEALRNRLGDIRGADNMYDVLAGNPKTGKYQNADCYRLELSDGFRLTVVPNHQIPRTSLNGETDWNLVRRVKVVSLET